MLSNELNGGAKRRRNSKKTSRKATRKTSRKVKRSSKMNGGAKRRSVRKSKRGSRKATRKTSRKVKRSSKMNGGAKRRSVRKSKRGSRKTSRKAIRKTSHKLKRIYKNLRGGYPTTGCEDDPAATLELLRTYYEPVLNNVTTLSAVARLLKRWNEWLRCRQLSTANGSKHSEIYKCKIIPFIEKLEYNWKEEKNEWNEHKRLMAVKVLDDRGPVITPYIPNEFGLRNIIIKIGDNYMAGRATPTTKEKGEEEVMRIGYYVMEAAEKEKAPTSCPAQTERDYADADEVIPMTPAQRQQREDAARKSQKPTIPNAPPKKTHAEEMAKDGKGGLYGNNSIEANRKAAAAAAPGPALPPRA